MSIHAYFCYHVNLYKFFIYVSIKVLLSQQEHLLSKDESPTNLEQAEQLMKRNEALLTTMDANDDKVIMSIYLCLSIHQSIDFYIYVYIYLSKISLTMHTSVISILSTFLCHLFVYLFTYPFTYHETIYLSIFTYVYMYIYLSI